MRRAFEDFSSGNHTQREVLQKLTALGLTTKRGARRTPQTFEKLLKNPIYAGRVVVKRWDIDRQGDFASVVSEGLFAKLQSLLKGTRPEPSSHSRDNPDFPLRRFVSCSECRKPLTGAWSRGCRARYAYHECRECRKLRVQKPRLEAQFVELLRSLHPKPRFMTLFKEAVQQAWQSRIAHSERQRPPIERECSVLQGQLDELVEAWLFKKRLDEATYLSLSTKLRDRLEHAKAALHACSSERADLSGVLAFAE